MRTNNDLHICSSLESTYLYSELAYSFGICNDVRQERESSVYQWNIRRMCRANSHLKICLNDHFNKFLVDGIIKYLVFQTLPAPCNCHWRKRHFYKHIHADYFVKICVIWSLKYNFLCWARLIPLTFIYLSQILLKWFGREKSYTCINKDICHKKLFSKNMPNLR